MPALPLEAALACLQGVTSHYVEKFSDQALMLPIDKRSMETMALKCQAVLNVFLAIQISFFQTLRILRHLCYRLYRLGFQGKMPELA